MYEGPNDRFSMHCHIWTSDLASGRTNEDEIFPDDGSFHFAKPSTVGAELQLNWEGGGNRFSSYTLYYAAVISIVYLLSIKKSNVSRS